MHVDFNDWADLTITGRQQECLFTRRRCECSKEIGMSNSKLKIVKNSFMFIMLTTVLGVATGCANFASPVEGPDPFSKGGEMKGVLYGGQSPIVGATVSLYSAGTSGYGSAGTLYAQTTTTGSGGSFSFTQTGSPGPTSPVTSSYDCPASGNPQMYLLATGGNPGSGTNANAAQIVAIGTCSTIGSIFVNMNEVTTVATIAAMQQYFNPTADTLGSPNTTQALLGFANAQAGISNLASIAGGTAMTSVTTPTSVTGVTLTATPESAKINTIANIIASCVNSTGALVSTDNCSVLFANAIPQTASLTSQPSATFATATDVVQATYYMLTNPTESQDNGGSGKLSKLFALVGGTPPFSGGLSTQPLDWTIGVAFTSTTGANCPSSSSFFINATLKGIAVDASGNIWANGGSGSANSLIEVSPTGAPMQCFPGLATSTGLTIDPTGNVWSASASSILEALAGGSSTLTWTGSNVGGIVADNAGNIFYTPTTAAALQEFKNASSVTLQANVTASTSVGTAITAGTYFYPVADAQGRILAPDNAASHFVDLYPVTPGTNGYTYADIGSSTFQAGSYGGAVDASGNFFGGNTCCAGTLNNTLYKLSIPAPATVGATPVISATNSAKYLGGVVAARGIAVDGAGNVWSGMADPVTNSTTGPPATPDIYALAEVNNALTVGISPNGVTPSTCSSTGPNCQTMGGFQKSALLPTTSIAIDLSGNVWAVSSNANHLTASLYEIVGQAVPVVTPLAVSPGVKP
jgi:hypothetical protein